MSGTEFTPKSVICLKEGYSRKLFWGDLFAGMSVGIIALPLAIAFAIASGVAPERGLFTAIIAGFLISALGGSRVQIGGPTGAYVVLVYGVVQRHGYEGLALATLLAGVMLVAMGLTRCGIFLKFIPYPVTTGFTTGIAVLIFFSQLKDLFGLRLEGVPASFLEKCHVLCQAAPTWNGTAIAIGLGTLALISFLRYLSPRLPGAMIVIAIATALVSFLGLPVETISSQFGPIPRILPTPALPIFSTALLKAVFSDAMSIALLGAIESLLSAAVADGLAGTKHRSNIELVAQGIANIGSSLFGGIPATGAIARTTANVRMGGKTPIAGMIHALTLLLLMFFLAPWAGQIPLAALAGVLIFVAWNMSELSHFWDILRGSRGDALLLILTFLLTVLIDLTVAVQVGVGMAALLFLQRMTDKTTVTICQSLVEENEHETAEIHDADILFRDDIPSDVLVFEIRGPFFYTVADLLDEALIRVETTPRVFILRVHRTPLIDATALQALRRFAITCKNRGILFLIADIDTEKRHLFARSGITAVMGQEHLFNRLEQALVVARRR